MNTKFASAKRNSVGEINRKSKLLDSVGHFKSLFNALPYITIIVDENRQIIFSNDFLIEDFGKIHVEKIIGKRPGEVLGCINSNIEEGGCGASQKCRICGIVNTILESQRNGTTIRKESILTIHKENNEIHFDMQVTAIPFYYMNEKFTILTLNDISNEKRRKALENIFFHDIINKAGSLNGFLDILKDIKDPGLIKEYITLALKISDELIEEILSQKSLLAAEIGELVVNYSSIRSLDFVKENINSIMFHPVAKNKLIEIDDKSDNISLKTDKLLLRRIMTNLLKNALEASSEMETIKVGCNTNGNFISFWVHNNGVLPEIVQMQIFHRSFSTKGINRGLGTYSVKLFGEKYLSGKVHFKSEVGFGTRFNIDLPKGNK